MSERLSDGLKAMPDPAERFPVGDAYAPNSSRRVPAHLDDTADDGSVDLIDSSDGRVLTSAPITNILFEHRLGNLPYSVRFPSGWRFLCRDHDKLDAVLGSARSSARSGHLHHWEAFRPRLFLLVALALATGIAVWRWGLAALVAAAIALTPDSLPPLIDRGHVAFIDQTWADPSRLGEDERQRVRDILNQLLPAAPTPRFGDYTLIFRSVPGIGPNAFALPGGTIVMTDALVRSFPDSDMIAGILGHEMAHISEVHGLKQVYSSLGTFLLVEVVFGNVGPVLEDMLLEGGLLMSLSHSRDHERQADRIGVKLAAESGYDPAALARFLEQVSAGETTDVPSWMSTHPDTAERIPWILDFAREFGRAD
ncbi:MAG: M48 family metallopeptidase [Paracoccaceae bacterium]|nr:M48 family metallopeptidase [Paracoccaceae bacterium]